MTNDEAINILKSKMDGSVDTSYEWCEAIRLAIKALEQNSEQGRAMSEKATKEEIDELAKQIAESGQITLIDIYVGAILAKLSAWYWKIRITLEDFIHGQR